MTSKTLSIVLGAGPGTGQALAIAFSKVTSAVAVLARNETSLKAVAAEVEKQGGVAKPFTCDAASEESILQAFKDIKEAFPDHRITNAIFNPGSAFIVKPFFELKRNDIQLGNDLNVYGAFTFSQQVIPLLLEAGGGSLLFTGATAAIRGSARFAAYSPSKFALRSLSQALAREFGPQGIHVAHTIVDGLIDTERVKGFAGDDFKEGKRISPESIAKSYVYLAGQDKSCWTQELDLRPSAETF